MAITKFLSEDAINEQSDSEYTCTFHDAGADAEQLDADAILTIVATLSAGSTVINDRDEEDVLNDNGGTLEDDGTFTLRLDSDDNAVVSSSAAPSVEEHRLSLEVTYARTGGGIGHLNHEVRFYVKKLQDVE